MCGHTGWTSIRQVECTSMMSVAQMDKRVGVLELRQTVRFTDNLRRMNEVSTFLIKKKKKNYERRHLFLYRPKL